MAYGAAVIWHKRILWWQFSRAVATVFCLFVVGFSMREVLKTFRAPDDYRLFVTYGERVNQLTDPAGLVIIANLGKTVSWMPEFRQHRTRQGEYLPSGPMDFYFSHRKGWNIDEEHTSPEFIETLRQRGAKYFVTYYPQFLERHPDLKAAFERSYTPLEVTSRWAIYRLIAPSARRTELSTPVLAEGADSKASQGPTRQN